MRTLMIILMITLTTDTSKSLVLPTFISPLYLLCRSRNSKNSEEDPTSQESEAAPPAGVNPERSLREEGNDLYNKGKYQPAIQKYEEAVRSGRCSVEEKVKCWRSVLFTVYCSRG